MSTLQRHVAHLPTPSKFMAQCWSYSVLDHLSRHLRLWLSTVCPHPQVSVVA